VDDGPAAGSPVPVAAWGRTGPLASRSTTQRSDIGIDPHSLDRTAAAWDERAIVDAVLAGDREAFRRLVERESIALVRACHRILGDRSDAEDAAQEALVTAYRQLASWRGDGPFGAWLMRIGIRIALRHAGKRRTVAWRDPLGGGSSGGSDRTQPVDPITRATDQAAIESAPLTDPAMLSMRAERATELRAAVTALPEPYREVVALRFFGDATLEEIARVTDRPLGTVKTNLYRGLARLRGVVERGDR
jgi:RNA polymerase sigma-70 factor, ECF subfamily